MSRGRDRTAVRREIRRNGGGRGCRHGQAQAKASARRGAASSVAGKMTPERWRTVEDRLAEGWSPDRTAGRFRKEGIPMAGRERICQCVRADRRAGGRLYLFLRRRGRKPDRKGGRHSGRGRIPDRTDISERPEIVEAKERIGDWEADTIVGKGRSGALASRGTLVAGRASNCTLLQRVGRKTAAAVGAAPLEMLLPLAALARTITADTLWCLSLSTSRTYVSFMSGLNWQAATARSSRATPGWRRRSGPGSSSRRHAIPGNGA